MWKIFFSFLEEGVGSLGKGRRVGSMYYCVENIIIERHKFGEIVHGSRSFGFESWGIFPGFFCWTLKIWVRKIGKNFFIFFFLDFWVWGRGLGRGKWGSKNWKKNLGKFYWVLDFLGSKNWGNFPVFFARTLKIWYFFPCFFLLDFVFLGEFFLQFSLLRTFETRLIFTTSS